MKIAAFDVILWLPEGRIEGVITLEENHFIYSAKKHDLSMVVKYSEITAIHEILLFRLKRNGLQIEIRNGRQLKIIMESPKEFKQMIQTRIS